MEIKILTPVEFDRDGYRQLWLDGEITVLAKTKYSDLARLDGCSREPRGHGYYTVSSWDWGDSCYKMRPYEHGLIVVKNPDYDELRRQLSHLVLTIPDDEVIYELTRSGWNPKAKQEATCLEQS